MPSERPAPHRLTLLGPWDLRGPDGEKVRSVLSQPKRLCLLAYLALAAEPVSRATLVALFWPESDEERARNALSQSLHYLRRSLGPQAVESIEGDRVLVSPERVWFDARALLRQADGAAPSSELRSAAGRICDGGTFFPGWNADDSQPLQDWLDEVRRVVRQRAEKLAASAEEAAEGEDDGPGDHPDTPSAPLSGRGRIPYSRAAWVGGGLLLGVVLTIAFRPAFGPPEAGATATGALEDGLADAPPAVAILLPRVTLLGNVPTFPAQALAEGVHDEVVARMETLEGVDIVSVGFESEVWQLVRSLNAQGTDRLPEWVVSIGIRSAGDQTRVVALLLRGPDYTETGAVSANDYPVPTGAEGLIELPKRIAEDLVEGLGGAVERD